MNGILSKSTKTWTDPLNPHLASYSPQGQLLWAKSVGGTSSDSISSTIQLSDGNLLVRGSYWGTMQLDANTSLTTAGGEYDEDGFVVSYSPQGKLLWAQSVGNVCWYDDYPAMVIELSDGSLVMSGSYESCTMHLDANTSLTSAGDVDGFLVRLEPQSGLSLGAHALIDPQTIFAVGNGSAEAPSNALTVLDSGNVGIGTDSPSSALQVVGTLTADALQLPDGTVLSSAADLGQGPAGPQGPQGIPGPAGPAGATGPQGPAGASPFALQSGNAVFTSGKVGIGTDTPSAELHVAGSLATEQIQFADGTTLTSTANLGNASALQDADGNAVVQVASDGRVGIGTDSPSAELEVAGDAEITGDLAVQGTLILSVQGDLSMGTFTTSE